MSGVINLSCSKLKHALSGWDINCLEKTESKMPEKRTGKTVPDKKGLKSMKDFLHDFFNPPKFVKPTETKKVIIFPLNKF